MSENGAGPAGSALIDLAVLAEAKALPADRLRGFGLSDERGGGVRERYRAPGGGPARDRIRREMSGPRGSVWDDGDAPITAYWRPEVVADAGRRGYLLLCEGESSCWTAWHWGVPAVGFPGADRIESLSADHIPDGAAVVIVVEPDDPSTYPDGAADYLARVRERLEVVDHRGEVLVLDLTGVAEDLNALHQQVGDGFADHVDRLVADARRAEQAEETTT